jgi:hypothetical protein
MAVNDPDWLAESLQERNQTIDAARERANEAERARSQTGGNGRTR